MQHLLKHKNKCFSSSLSSFFGELGTWPTLPECPLLWHWQGEQRLKRVDQWSGVVVIRVKEADSKPFWGLCWTTQQMINRQQPSEAAAIRWRHQTKQPRLSAPWNLKHWTLEVELGGRKLCPKSEGTWDKAKLRIWRKLGISQWGELQDLGGYTLQYAISNS